MISNLARPRLFDPSEDKISTLSDLTVGSKITLTIYCGEVLLLFFIIIIFTIHTYVQRSLESVTIYEYYLHRLFEGEGVTDSLDLWRKYTQKRFVRFG